MANREERKGAYRDFDRRHVANRVERKGAYRDLIGGMWLIQRRGKVHIGI